MSRKRRQATPDPDDDDRALFRDALGDVLPLNSEPRAPVPRRRPAARALQRERDEAAVMDELLDHDWDPAEPETGEELNWARAGVQRRVVQRLRRGQYSVQDSIDLHHMNATTARRVLLEFLDQALGRGLSCVRVVHGKGLRSHGGPKLKPMAAGLLRRHPAVVAYASCRPVDGGTGATQVLLRAQGSRRPPR